MITNKKEAQLYFDSVLHIIETLEMDLERKQVRIEELESAIDELKSEVCRLRREAV